MSRFLNPNGQQNRIPNQRVHVTHVVRVKGDDMSKGTVIGIRNVLIGCVLAPIAAWIVKGLFGTVPTGVVGVVVMTVMVMEAAEKAFRAGKKTLQSAPPPSANQSVRATP